METVFTFTLAALPQNLFSLCIDLSTVRYCVFFVRLAPISVRLLFPSLKNVTPVGFDKHVVLQWRRTSFLQKTFAQKSTHLLVQAQYDIFKHMNTCSHVGAT